MNGNQTDQIAKAGAVFMFRAVAVKIITVLLLFLSFIAAIVFYFVLTAFSVPPVYALTIVICGPVIFWMVAFWSYKILMTFQTKKHFDRAFAFLNLSGSFYRLYGREYQGNTGGRAVEIFFHARRENYFAPSAHLDILIQTPLKTRFSTAAPLAQLPPVRHNIHNLQNLNLAASEEMWARSLIEHPTVQQSLIQMRTGTESFGKADVNLYPGLLHLHFSGRPRFSDYGVTPELAEQWLAAAFNFLQLAETQVPPPQNPLEMTSAESAVIYLKKKDFVSIFVILLIGFFAVVIFLTVIFVSLVAYFDL